MPEYVRRMADTKPMIACCGLTCSLCEAYRATQKNDDEGRRKVSEKWSKVLKVEIRPEQINCDGCLSDEKHFFYCQTCEIRTCCAERHIDNCAYCEDYPCGKLEGVFKSAPYAKITLDETRNKRLTKLF